MKRLSEAQAILLAAFITGAFAIIASLVTPAPRLETNVAQTSVFASQTSIPTDQPIVIPTDAPEPTIVGTPLIGADVAAGGRIGFTVVANGISLVVDEVRAYDRTFDGFLPIPGYAFVVVKLRVVIDGWHILSGYEFLLVDDRDNRYRWQTGLATSGFNISLMPVLSKGESWSGGMVYEVPVVALDNKLRLRLEPDPSLTLEKLSTRIEIFFDPIPLEQP